MKKTPPEIRILPENVANKIAAGEVIERPSAVVKELLENSIDAGATRIDIEFKNGGKSFVKIMDNGCGMTREQALMSLEPHATSKSSAYALQNSQVALRPENYARVFYKADCQMGERQGVKPA